LRSPVGGGWLRLQHTLPRQCLLSPRDHHGIFGEVRLPARLRATLLIAIAQAAITNAEQMVRLTAAARSTLAALLLAPDLQLGHQCQHVIKPLVEPSI
jgi:hypothetical protein